ncbi:PGN_0703 family putative restriction endonuclease, partial [Macellibacteroides fermentans]|uniref:PGN_0703 family putative restriction endonuclease n=1 Tax=Macellibacteroides fermentans TaxID=879969 RepID=UPI00406D319E
GNTRLSWYSDLIQKSSQINHYEGKKLRGSLYFFEPFYQLMRQTLWAEQMVRHNSTEYFQAEDYIHVHVVPADNKDLLDTSYPQPGGTMEDTWRSVFKDQNKYKIIDPKSLFSLIDKKYESLVDYLANRYWNRIQ